MGCSLRLWGKIEAQGGQGTGVGVAVGDEPKGSLGLSERRPGRGAHKPVHGAGKMATFDEGSL